MSLTAADFWYPLDDHPNLAVLRTDDAKVVLPRAMRDLMRGVVDPLVDLDAAQRDRLIAALRLSTPAVLESTRYVAVAGFESAAAGLVGFATSDSLAVRNDSFAGGGGQSLEHITVHELAHVFDIRLAGVQRQLEQVVSRLPSGARGSVREHLLERTRRRLFDQALRYVFTDLMRSARDAGLTSEDYCAPGAPAACFLGMVDRARQAGIAEPYGLFTSAEDVATWVAGVHENDATGHAQSATCTALRDASDWREPGLLVAYVKLALLRGAGAITDADFDACVGSFPVPRADAPGIYLQGPDGTRFDLPTDPQAGWAPVSGEDMFSVIASGGPYTGAIQVLTPGHRFPRPVAVLSDINVITVDYPQNGFFLSHASDEHLARASASGLVVYTSVSASGVEGLVLFLELQSDIAVTDRFPLGTFRYDE